MTKSKSSNSARLITNSAALRIWHWANTLILSGSLITVLLNSTILKGRSNTTYIIDELQMSGVTITKQQSESVAYGLENRMWDVHIYFGYFLIAFLLFRLSIEFFQSPGQRIITKVKSLFHDSSMSKTNFLLAGDHLAVKIIYLVFYILILVMCCTGLSLVYQESLGISDAIRHTIKEIHGFCMYPILGFIVIHLAGVFLAERNDRPGIIPDMVNGGKKPG